MQLRDFRAEDVNAIVLQANNPRVAKYLRDHFPSPYTVADGQWWVTEGHLQGPTCNQAITLADRCIGAIGVRFLENEYRFSAELGYWLGEAYWQQGIATTATQTFCDSVFSNYPVKRIYASVAHANQASAKALLKSGFQLEGVFKQNIYLRGVLYDEQIYALYPRPEKY
ncbi:GNAT family protein [Halioxenophilus sp. WMMB6]|uniref:GNAT family N-acetyltransferase n=1 Tax=Halioxenophilus sp. WMMB6 TaxID=3073815 RepID=UPI00295EE00B|nr:GNAT family protein [Halioxenophilus sp. WMMB6]